MERTNTTNERFAGSWDVAYRKYQSTLTTRFLLPVLGGWGIRVAGSRVLEVGCGDGGCAAEFARAGADVAAVDIDARLVSIARELNAADGLEFPVHTGDITAEECPGRDDGPWDLILLRDVMEHIEPLGDTLAVLRDRLAQSGRLFVVFPPYYSPYGGHQQILPRRGSRLTAFHKMPWVQLLPDALFLSLAAGPEASSREVRRLRGVRLTLRKFERAVRRAGMRVESRRHYLLRPTYSLRYRAPVLPAGPLGLLPAVRELIITAGYFLVGRDVRA